MIFDLTANSGKPKKLPVLDSSYPADASVTIGNSVIAKVVISTDGYPAKYTYQWYKNGSVVSGATSPTYTFTPTEIGSTTIYCEVANAAGIVTSRVATITGTATYLYNKGDECTAATNGWSAKYWPSTSYYIHGTLTKNSGNMTLVSNGAASTSTGAALVAVMTGTNVYLKNANKLYVRVTNRTVSGSIAYSDIYIRTTTSIDASSNVVALKSITGTGLFSVDVSSLTGSYYISVQTSAEGNAKITLAITEVYYA